MGKMDYPVFGFHGYCSMVASNTNGYNEIERILIIIKFKRQLD